MEARRIHYHTFLRIPSVANDPGVELSSFQKARHSVSSTNQGNIISVKQAIEPQAIIETLWRLIKGRTDRYSNLTQETRKLVNVH
jgi:hypothetical protein